MTLVAGVDFGTASVRVSIVDADRGRLSAGVAEYPVLRNVEDPHRATQRHEDHCRALEKAFEQALARSNVKGRDIASLAIDTTGSTVVPVGEHLQPLSDYYLWCDHRAWKEAQEITDQAQLAGLPHIQWCGGTYSSEWGFAKILHWLRHNSELRSQFVTALEHCDLMVASLCGINDAEHLPRSVCAAGHKWMWNRDLGGFPPESFLTYLDPLLKGIRDRLSGHYGTSSQIAGHLSEEWATRLRLRPGIPIPIGALDAHWDAIGAGCKLGDVVNVIGTSTCIMALTEQPKLIPGVCGIVPGSIHPAYLGIEGGLSAVGDLFEAIARRASSAVASLADQVQHYRPGQTGLLRFAWDNGDRSVRVDPALSGITLGWRLHHTAADEFFAAMEGTAFHTRIVLDRLQEYGTPIERVIHAGGIPQRNEVLNRIYAAVLGKPILVPESDTTSLGSAIFAFLAAGVFKSVDEAQDALSPGYRTIEPANEDVKIYQDLYFQFRELYFSWGRPGAQAQ